MTKNASNSQIKKHTIFLLLGWTVIISVLAAWNISRIRQTTKDIAINEARSHFKRDQALRHWAASHGGVYVKVDATTPPNPSLSHIPERDIVTPAGKELTLMNPAYMIRQLNDYFAELYGVAGHLTSLKVLRPENKPDAWEEKALRLFEQGTKEKGLFIKKGERTAYFYMAPLKTKQSCMTCHAKQGYKVGDIRGAIGITLPFVLNIPISMLLFVHIGIGLIGLIGIAGAGFMLNKSCNIIKEQTVIDSLTGIPNRRYFSENIRTEFIRSQRDQQPL